MSLSMYGSYPENGEVIISSLWTGVPALLLIETVKQIAYVDNTGRYERGSGPDNLREFFYYSLVPL